MTIERKTFSRGAELSHKTTTYIPAEAKLRPLRDVIIVEPLDGVVSAIIHIIEERKPVRGIVRAVGPGVYPIRYDHSDKHRRTKMWHSKAFRRTEVKIGDIVELDVVRAQGMQTFYHGDKLHLLAREEDVAGVHPATCTCKPAIDPEMNIEYHASKCRLGHPRAEAT